MVLHDVNKLVFLLIAFHKQFRRAFDSALHQHFVSATLRRALTKIFPIQPAL